VVRVVGGVDEERLELRKTPAAGSQPKSPPCRDHGTRTVLA
jgi:hypothetical protein